MNLTDKPYEYSLLANVLPLFQAFATGFETGFAADRSLAEIGLAAIGEDAIYSAGNRPEAADERYVSLVSPGAPSTKRLHDDRRF